MRKQHSLFLVLFVNIYFYSLGQNTFIKSYTGGYLSSGSEIKQTFNGGVILAGYIHEIGSSNYGYLVNTNLNGDTIWTKIIDVEYINAIEQTSDSGFILTGSIHNSVFNSSDIFLLKINSMGNFMWIKDYYDYLNWGNSVFQTADGGYVIAGDNGSGPIYALIIKTDSTGTVAWNKKIMVGNNTYRNKAFQAKDGNYIIHGLLEMNGGNDSAMYIAKLDSMGTLLWTKSYVTGSNNQSYDNNVSETPDGGLIFSGNNLTSGLLLKTDDNGDALWEKAYNKNITSLTVASDSGFIMTGFWDLLLTKTDSGGNIIWSKSLVDPGTISVGHSSLQSGNGSIFILGDILPFGNVSEFLLEKTDEQGGGCIEHNKSTTITSIPFQIANPSITVTSPLINVSSPVPGERSGSQVTEWCVAVKTNDPPDSNILSFFPNPYYTTLTLQFPHQQKEEAHLFIYNSIGEVAWQKEILMEDQMLDLAELPPGLYLVNLKTKSGFFSSKIIRE